MKLQIASDLHHEHTIPGSPISQPLVVGDSSVDVLVLAGDIGNQLRGIELHVDYPVPIVYVCTLA